MGSTKWFNPKAPEFEQYRAAIIRAMRDQKVTQTTLSKTVGISQPDLSRFICGYMRHNTRLSERIWTALVNIGNLLSVTAPVLPEWHPKAQSVAAEIRSAKSEPTNKMALTVLEMVQSGEVSPKAAAKLLAKL